LNLFDIILLRKHSEYLKTISIIFWWNYKKLCRHKVRICGIIEFLNKCFFQNIGSNRNFLLTPRPTFAALSNVLYTVSWHLVGKHEVVETSTTNTQPTHFLSIWLFSLRLSLIRSLFEVWIMKRHTHSAQQIADDRWSNRTTC